MLFAKKRLDTRGPHISGCKPHPAKRSSRKATVITAPKHAKAIQERADAVAAELRKKFTLKE
jgi:hypothetical protein